MFVVGCAGFLVLAGRVEVGVGVKARAQPDRAAAVGALTAAPFGACCSGQEGRKALWCFRCGCRGGRWRLQCRFPGAGQGDGAAGHSFAAVCGMKRFAGTAGRDQSEGATSPGSGVMTCTIRGRPSVWWLTPRAVSGAGPGRGDRAARRRRARAVFGPRRRCCGCRGDQRPVRGYRR
jgi:hypothetical protein